MEQAHTVASSRVPVTTFTGISTPEGLNSHGPLFSLDPNEDGVSYAPVFHRISLGPNGNLSNAFGRADGVRGNVVDGVGGDVGGDAMPKPDEYRTMAEECLRSAREAQTNEERQLYLNLARVWLEFASRQDAEAPSSRLPPSPRLKWSSAD